ncbi:MAG: UbiD family decarboxylase, partial [Betaproteobacteria bacterium]|nr:UbiD family decarboxylase [Betaproteobacteria bacterium]
MSKSERGYADLHDHLDALRKRGLLIEVDRPIDKDAEMHPLVRWQYVGGIEEHERKAFLFTNVVNAQGRKYKFPVVVGAFAGNREIYGVGMGVPLDEVPQRWDRAIANPIPPNVVEQGACQ